MGPGLTFLFITFSCTVILFSWWLLGDLELKKIPLSSRKDKAFRELADVIFLGEGRTDMLVVSAFEKWKVYMETICSLLSPSYERLDELYPLCVKKATKADIPSGIAKILSKYFSIEDALILQKFHQTQTSKKFNKVFTPLEEEVHQYLSQVRSQILSEAFEELTGESLDNTLTPISHEDDLFK